jgi:acetyl-CoA acetyltransferase
MAIADSAAARGEPWLGLYQPADISEMLRSKGFRMIEDLGLAELTKRFYGALKQGIAIGPGGHVVRARKDG